MTGTAAPPYVGDVVDVEGVTAALDGAKAALVQAIGVEVHRAARDVARGGRLTLNVTPRMRGVIAALYRRGVREAQGEMGRLGYQPVVRYRLDLRDTGLRTRVVEGRLAVQLAALARRMEDTLDRDPLAVMVAVRADIERALDRVPGARSAAAAVVSEAFIAGSADLYRENEDAFGGYQATSVLDGNTCPRCSAVDGTVYRTLDAAAAAGWGNGGFGPYAACQGGPRCRCRVIPLPPAAPPPGFDQYPEPIGPVDPPSYPTVQYPEPIGPPVKPPPKPYKVTDLDKKSSGMWKGLDAAPRKALADYRGDAYSLNQYLRNGGPFDPYRAVWARLINQAIETVGVALDEGLVYRAGNLSHLLQQAGVTDKKSLVGAKITERAYLRTSQSYTSATKLGDAVLEIEVPAGTRAVWMRAVKAHNDQDDRKELLLPHGLTLEVTGVRTKAGKTVVRARITGDPPEVVADITTDAPPGFSFTLGPSHQAAVQQPAAPSPAAVAPFTVTKALPPPTVTPAPLAVSPTGPLLDQYVRQTQEAVDAARAATVPTRGMEDRAMRSYFGSGYGEINGSLREGRRGHGDTDAYVRAMDGYFTRAPGSPRDFVSWRGIRGGERILTGLAGVSRIEDLVGHIIQDKGFVSTSADQRVAFRFSGGGAGSVVFRVRTPKGAPVGWAPDLGSSYGMDEAEILMPRDSRFLVRAVTREQGRVFVDVDVIS